MVEFKIGQLPENIGDRLKYLYRLQEKLRLYHNKKGRDYKDEKITLGEFREFQRTWFDPRSNLICEQINKCKDNLASDNTIICSITDIEEN